MSVYLNDIPLPKAQDCFKEALRKAGRWKTLGVEKIPLDEQANGRVLAEAIWAKISSPHYHASAMDGFAVRSESTDNAMLTSPVTLVLGNQAEYVDTGDPLPGWANAVIQIEDVEPIDNEGNPESSIRKPFAIRVRSSIPPWHHVRPVGEDIIATELVLPARHTLHPVDLGAIAACGHDDINVVRRPKVAILPTGSELIAIGKPIEVGSIIEYNSLVMAAQVHDWGGEAIRYPIVPDDYGQIRSNVVEAAKNSNLILLIAGSSAGAEDYSAKVIESLGDLLVHGVAIRPGHPVILGMINLRRDTSESDLHSSIPVIGVPGYPVSAALTGEIFVKPLIELWLGRKAPEPQTIKASITRKVTSPAGDDDYMRVAVGRVGNRILAAPLSRGAGVISSLVRADGITVIPRGIQGYQAGTDVDVVLKRPLSEIKKTIFVIGSHDITLDVLAQFLSIGDRRLVSSNVGSLGGLIALRRGEAHLAGSHLLDPESGEYNISYIQKYLPGVAVKIIALVEREQGLLVKKGNPQDISTLNDLVNKEVTFINRQRGAGTRVLLDYHLDQLHVDPAAITGYDQEEYTHLTLAAAIASGRASCGLGIAAAATALDLEFIPLFHERYDLIIPTEHFESELLSPLMDVLENPAFHRSVSDLPGYNTARMGEQIADIKGNK